MLVSESWIREWVSPAIDTNELGEKLTLAGLEVDTIASAGPALDNKRIVVGRICSVVAHPNSKKLQVCEVDVGRKKNLSIICGAPNARKDLVTAVATNGAELPGMTVGNREIRGVQSFGMLCSGMELGLDDSTDGIIELDSTASIGTGIANYLDLQDQVVELELTPNRGDCLGIAGIAREIATLTGTKLNHPGIPKTRAKNKSQLDVVLDAPEACPRYVGRAIKNINMSADTPDWMVERLRRSGLRSINPIVDVTNYVMHELGQPMHAFDMAKISGGICVRMAKQGEKHKLLDGSTVKLRPDNLVIADHKKAIALAGIMGGDNSAISTKTVDIYLEAAFFSPDYILGKARTFGMHTDASHRFERGVDYMLQTKAMDRATELVMAIAGGEAGPVTHAVDSSSLPGRKPINFDRAEIFRTLGIKIPARKVSRILEDLGMKVKPRSNGWKVTAPSWRFDIQAQYDLVEEVGRCFGFEHVEAKMPAFAQKTGAHLEKSLSTNAFKDALVSLGYHEAITYSFVDPDYHNSLLGGVRPIKLVNPIADNMSVMRQSLWPGLLDALRINLNRQENRVRLFEIGHVFSKAKNSRKSIERNNLAGLICGTRQPRQWGASEVMVDFFDLKGDIESALRLVGVSGKWSFCAANHPALHPGQSAGVLWNNRKIGYIGKLHPSHMKLYDLDAEVYLFELDLSFLGEKNIPEFKGISKYPAVQRDLAFLVDQDVPVNLIFENVRSAAGDLLFKLDLFDIYMGENIEKNKKSLAFSLTFKSESSNLTSSQMDELTNSIIAKLEHKVGAQLRD
jgi:phenylalanyl-tRNA synthetase beta chain